MSSGIGENKPANCICAVELFSGIGGFRIACDALGIQTIWANDLSRLSCDVYRDAFGKAELIEGNVREFMSEIPPHDLLTAGFPCQPFSSAGKKQGTRDPRGSLFEDIIRVLRSTSPRWFVLENVKRLLSMEKGDHFATILLALSELDYLVEWRVLNAISFGLPQNRDRLIVVGTKMPAMNDARIMLAPHGDLRCLIQRDLAGLQRVESWRCLEQHRQRFPTWGMCFKGRYFAHNLAHFSEATSKPALNSILEKQPPEEFFMDKTTLERISNSSVVNRMVHGVQVLYNQNGGARMGYTVFGTDGVAPTLTASHSRHYERYKVGGRYRRLTNREYARLQGFPDDHCAVASTFDQYGLYGNAVPPPLVEWAISRITSPKGIALASLQPLEYTQLSLAL